MTLHWIPYFLGLEESARVQRMARKHLKVHAAQVVGHVLRLYGWLGERVADAHKDGLDAVLELPDAAYIIDGVVGFDGFAEALAGVGWISIDGDRLRIVRFFEKNGTLALKKAAEQQKKARQRGMADGGPSETGARMADRGTGAGQERDTGGTKAIGPMGPMGHIGPISGDGGGDKEGTGAGTAPGPEEGRRRVVGGDLTTTGTKTTTTTFEELVVLLSAVGVAEGVARGLVREHSAAAVAMACKMALDAKATGATRPQGIAVARLKDGTAQRAVGRGEAAGGGSGGGGGVGGGVVGEARAWCRGLLEREKAVEAKVFERVLALEEFRRWDQEKLRATMPDRVLIVAAEVIEELVLANGFDASSVPVGFLGVVGMLKARG